MATDDFKPKGQTKASEPDSGGGVIRSVPVLGVVKNNIDTTHSGRIEVYIADFGTPDSDDSSSWTPVSYMSPFFGNTGSTSGTDSKDYGSFATNPVSYGMWFSPPDIGSTVICILPCVTTTFLYSSPLDFFVISITTVTTTTNIAAIINNFFFCLI